MSTIHTQWSGREDLNLRPLAPHASTLPGCATPRTGNYIKQHFNLEIITEKCIIQERRSDIILLISLRIKPISTTAEGV